MAKTSQLPLTNGPVQFGEHRANYDTLTAAVNAAYRPRGNWVAGSYDKNETVILNSVEYASQVDSNTATPGTDATKWLKIGGAGVATPLRILTANGTIAAADEVIVLDGQSNAVDATLPLAANYIKPFWIKRRDNSGTVTTNVVRVVAASGDTIDGAANKGFSMQREAYQFARVGPNEWGVF